MTLSGLNSGLFLRVEVFGIRGLPEIDAKTNLPKTIGDAFTSLNFKPMIGDILVVTQKIISKAEGNLVNLKDVVPSEFAVSTSRRIKRDARLIEVVLRETRRIVRMDRDILICETKHGFICANAGVDQSNLPGRDIVCLLPVNPDESAHKLRKALRLRLKINIPVIIVDTFGRPWREGLTNVAIGVSGLKPLKDLRGKRDRYGYRLRKTVVALADEIASAAELVMSKNDAIPVAVVRGVSYETGNSGIKGLLRSPKKDLFR